MPRLVLLGEILDSSPSWLDPVTAAHEHRSLSEGVAVEELRRPPRYKFCDPMLIEVAASPLRVPLKGCRG